MKGDAVGEGRRCCPSFASSRGPEFPGVRPPHTTYRGHNLKPQLLGGARPSKAQFQLPHIFREENEAQSEK